MSSQLSAHAITAHTAITRISVSRCSTLPAHRGSARAEKCSTSFSADIAILPSSIKGEPAQPVSPSEPARPFHALPLDPPRKRPSERIADLHAFALAGLYVRKMTVSRTLRTEGHKVAVQGLQTVKKLCPGFYCRVNGRVRTTRTRPGRPLR